MSDEPRTAAVLDVSMIRIAGILVARFLVDGMTPKAIGAWFHSVAVDVARPTDADQTACKLCGQLVAEGR